MLQPAKNTICLRSDGVAEDASRFYAETFPDSSVVAVHRAPGDFPSGRQGEVLTVWFTVAGIPCLRLNGGSTFTHTRSVFVSGCNGRPTCGPDPAVAKRAFDAMTTMKKIDIAAIEAARRG